MSISLQIATKTLGSIKDGLYQSTATVAIDAEPPAVDKLMSAQDLLDWVSGDISLSLQKRRNEMSAIRALGRVTKQPLSIISLEPAYLNKEIFALTPVQAGYRANRWKHIRTYCGQALKRAGILVVAVRRRNKLSLGWQSLLERFSEKPLGYRLSALARFCSAQGVEAASLTQETLDRFREEETKQTAKGPKAYGTYRTTCRTWNEAARRFAWWPQIKVEVPDYSNRFSLPKDKFLASFWQDVAAYADASSAEQQNINSFAVLDKKAPRPLRPATIIQRIELFWEMASAQVRSGRKIEEIDSLTALLQPQWVKAGLAFLWERYGKKTKRLHEFASAMKSTAINWGGLDKAAQDELSMLCKAARLNEVPGFSEKNKQTLLQFEDPENVRRLLLLPWVLAHEVRAKKKITHEDARLMMGALAIEILLTSMVRLENLASIDRIKNVRTVGTGKHQRRQLIFPGQYVKNGKDLTFDLTPRTWDLWDLFVAEYRPLLLTEASSQLFPSSGKNRNGRLRHLISKLVRQRIGLKVTPHQFRHIGVWLYLEAHPNDFERPRIMLGHKSDRTLKRYYAWKSESDAVNKFTEAVFAGHGKLFGDLEI